MDIKGNSLPDRAVGSGDSARTVLLSETWTPTGSLHHIGLVVESIVSVAPAFAETLHANWDGNIVHDPKQNVRVTFLESRTPGNPLVELVEPADEKSPVFSFLQSGGGLHHVCYLTDSLERQLEECRTQGALVVRPPVEAVAFGGRRIAWIYSKQKLLIEYLERF